MTLAPQSLAEAPWLSTATVQSVFAALEQDGAEARIVGGAVRNALLGVPVADIDFATTATPDIVSAQSKAAGFKVVPTGIEHGTLTVLAGGNKYEVTTLREDIETDGRRAVVRFGRDWIADARRRDFTVNALSVDAKGTLYDPLGGYDDVLTGRIRFVGEPGKRIAEDRLRVLRFFRFYAQYGKGDLDGEGLTAAIRARDALRDLSAERIGQEMRQIAVARGALKTVTAMQDSGILPIVLGGVGYIGALRRLQEFENSVDMTPKLALRVAAFACRVEEDALRLAGRMRLANATRDRMRRAIAAINEFGPRPQQKAARRALYRLGEESYRDGVALAFGWNHAPADSAPWRELYALPDEWSAPTFPLGGRDVLGGTSLRGPSVGALLKGIEAWWVENDFVADEPALRDRLRELIAAANELR